MATVAEGVGHSNKQQRRWILLPFLVVAAAFGAVEYVLELIPGSLSASLDLPTFVASVFNAAVRAILIPCALLLVFYILAGRMPVDLRRSRFAIALSVFLGTLIVFLPVDVGDVAFDVTGAALPGFTTAEAAVISVGDAVSSSLNHAFIGVAAVFLWYFLSAPPSTPAYSQPGHRLHGTEDVSIVGVAMVGVYAWQYLAQAYQATYLLGVKSPLAAFLASILGGGSSIYYTAAIFQEIILLMVLPFVLYYLVVRTEGLNPFVQGRKIALVILLWALFLRIFLAYSYIYFAQLFDPAAFPGQTLVSTLGGELSPANLIGIVASSLTFVCLGMAAAVFGYFSWEARHPVATPRPTDPALQPEVRQ